ncbi:hypothetical protein [Marinobacterium mangrovicola]|uniref:Parallel beta helix pectate lyase-like protein n=1 Tax=Marinobacterium mangrovicola TaxID=1476959 RepID=A0A4R1GGR8_9GAMM|nr:hypothetical protein [Marinobacterium mangrovicola]TCK07534.1 hypothetical protein CLV83_2405 [Marinobacterium mangrovicola]
MKLVALLVLILLARPLLADTTYYIDPTNGSDENNGSKDYPWKTIQGSIKNSHVAFGKWKLPYNADRPRVVSVSSVESESITLILKPGFYGRLEIISKIFEKELTIKSEYPYKAVFDSVYIKSSGNIKIEGLTITRSVTHDESKHNLFSAVTHDWTGPSKNITLKNSLLYSKFGRDQWSVDDWLKFDLVKGIDSDAEQSRYIGNIIINTSFAVTISGKDTLVKENVINGFRGDGIRSIGDDNTFESNVIINSFDVDENHDDGFQAWVKRNEEAIRRNRLINNVIVARTDSNGTLYSNNQGIGLFDGMYDNWEIRDNFVVVNHWHGLSMYGITNSEIMRNVVFDPFEDRVGPAEIRVMPAKNGDASANNILRKNCAHNYIGIDSTEIRTNKKINYPTNIDALNPGHLGIKETTSYDEVISLLKDYRKKVEAHCDGR